MSNDIRYSESDLYGHTRTRHVEQYWHKLVRIQAIKLNDRNIISDRELQNILDDPDGVDSYIVMRNMLRGVCNDIVHATIPTVHLFKMLNDLQYQIYMNSRRWKQIAEQVRFRDGNKCTVCGLTDIDSQIKYNQKLSVHHENYDNTYAEDPDQLVTLCDGCHKDRHADHNLN